MTIVSDTPFPPPGTLEDLLADAANLGWATNERMLRSWNTKGLLGSPARQSRGRNLGQAPAIYTTKQRRLFQLLAAQRRAAHLSQLARAVVYVWMSQPDGWVDSEQATRAFHTAIGTPRTSLRVARAIARRLVLSLGPSISDRGSRDALIDAIAAQLREGRFDATMLAPFVEKFLRTSAPGTLPEVLAERTPHAVMNAIAIQVRGSITIDNKTQDALETARLVSKYGGQFAESEEPQLPPLANTADYVVITEQPTNVVDAAMRNAIMYIAISRDDTFTLRQQKP
jgi:hypothetical protein